MKFSITKRRKRNFRPLPKLTTFMKQTKKRHQFSDCKIFGKRGLMYILFTANLKNKGRLHLAQLQKGKVVRTLQTITAKTKFSALKGEFPKRNRVLTSIISAFYLKETAFMVTGSETGVCNMYARMT